MNYLPIFKQAVLGPGIVSAISGYVVVKTGLLNPQEAFLAATTYTLGWARGAYDSSNKTGFFIEKQDQSPR